MEQQEKMMFDYILARSNSLLEGKAEEEVIEPEIVDAGSEKSASRKKSDENPVSSIFRERFGARPFPLTAAKLERLVFAIDRTGPMQLGYFYPMILKSECELLIPYPIYHFGDYEFRQTVERWCVNRHFFRCPAIGAILEVYSEIIKENNK